MEDQVDFGSDLLPHEIAARALDAKGREVARAQEWVNLPHPLTKVDIVLEGARGQPAEGRRGWSGRTSKGQQPRSVTLTFDGLPVPLDADGRAPLPPHDLKSIHVLSAEVEFSPLRSVRKDMAYGGEYGSEVSTELTGVPVRVRRGKLPPPEKLGGWLTAAGQPLPVAAVEEGPAQLFVVRSPDAREIAELGRRAKRGRVHGRSSVRRTRPLRLPVPPAVRSVRGADGPVRDLHPVHGPRYGSPDCWRGSTAGSAGSRWSGKGGSPTRWPGRPDGDHGEPPAGRAAGARRTRRTRAAAMPRPSGSSWKRCGCRCSSGA